MEEGQDTHEPPSHINDARGEVLPLLDPIIYIYSFTAANKEELQMCK